MSEFILSLLDPYSASSSSRYCWISVGIVSDEGKTVELGGDEDAVKLIWEGSDREAVKG